MKSTNEGIKMPQWCNCRKDSVRLWTGIFACILLLPIPKRYLPLLGEGRNEEKASNHTTICDEIRGRGVSLNLDSSEQSASRKTEKKYTAVINVTAKERIVCGPQVLLIGAMKCGTNSIGQILKKHPRVKLHTCNRTKDKMCDSKHYQGTTSGMFWEMHAFTHLYNEFQMDDVWIDLYAQMLPHGENEGFHDMIEGSITIDKSPSYLNTDRHPGVELRARRMLPHAKIIVTLCDPTGRLYSHYHHMKRAANEKFEGFYHHRNVSVPTNFSVFVGLFDDISETCQTVPGFCDLHRTKYLHLGEYHKHLHKWTEAFGDENILVLDMLESQLVQTHKILEHLGSNILPKAEYPWEIEKKPTVNYVNPTYSGRASGYNEHAIAMKWLSEYYAPHNLILAKAIGQSWPLEWARHV